MLTNEIETDYENGQWVTKTQAAVIYEVAERTIENRIRQGLYPSKVEEGKTLVFVKDRTEIETDRNRSKQPKQVSQRIETTSNLYETITKNQEMLSQAFEQMAQVQKRVLEISEVNTNAQIELEKKQAELIILNNERANYNNKLQKASEEARENAYLRGELEALRQENNALKRQLEGQAKGWIGKIFGK